MADENGITISQHLHKFRAFSELKKEAKGGYIEAKIKIPHHCPNFQLALYSTNNYGDHTNLLHITPYNRQKNISSNSISINLCSLLIAVSSIYSASAGDRHTVFVF